MATNVTAMQESGAAGDGVVNLGKCLNKTKYRSVYELCISPMNEYMYESPIRGRGNVMSAL